MPKAHLSHWTAAVAMLASVSFLGVALAQTETVLDPREDIRSTYDFEPTTMTFAEQANRAATLSSLWARFDKKPDAYRDALRSELRATGNREILYCDGGMLLLAKSNDPDDRPLGLSSIQRCSLAEIQHTPYFYTLHMLARGGVDTFDLQTRILSKPKYSVFIVQHALSLGQDYAFLYPFLVQDEAMYVPRLISRLRVESDPIAQKSVIRALWYAATPAAEAAVRAAAADQRIASVARDDATRLLQSLDSVRGWRTDDPSLRRIYAMIDVSPSSSDSELRAKRKARMRSISDEALHDLEAYTALIYRTRRGV
jgi:hypothetical protein